jgi:hypothetical protein
VPVDLPPFDALDVQSQPLDQTTDDHRVYGYANVDLFGTAVATLGFNYTDVQSEFLQISRWNPKLGLQWDVTSALRMRGAYFKTVKPVLASNRVLEPTQVAGFNQFFDDADSTQSTGYGLGIDWRPMSSLHAGFEFTGRSITHPSLVIRTGSRFARFESRHERAHRAYVNWTPTKRWAVGVEGIYDSFTNAVPSTTVPRRVITRMAPLQVRYFHPNGLFGGTTGTLVSQKVARENSTLAQGSSHFATLDVFAGYRLPRRLGVVSLAVHNLFDRRFRYQDDSYRSFGEEPSGTGLIPERTVMGRVTLSY